MADVVVYGNPLSTYTRTVRMALVEKGVAYDLEPVDFRAPEYRKVHPFGKIPAMRHGDFQVYETMAMAKYIDRAFDGPALQPDAPRPRAVMDQWISATLDYFYAAMVRKLVFERLVAPAQDRAPDEALVQSALPEIDLQIRVLADALDRTPYLAGEDMTLADLFVQPVLFYVNFTPEGRERLAGTPILDWLDRMNARDSAEATMPPIDKL
mgnify:CR=1 FL=1